MLQNNKTFILITIYFIFLLCIAPYNLLSFDTYYYWDWSRHLDLAYFDGPPMIAYFIKISTFLWGDTLFALSIIGIVSVGISCILIYKTARLFLTKDASIIATLIFLFSPTLTANLLQQTTYDTPLMLFWVLTIYLVINFIKSNKPNLLIFIGFSIGLMLLAKYSGLVLVLSLLIFLHFSRYRNLFKNRKFYYAIIAAIIIFSPVIIWNYQHNWQSFLYQLKEHKLTEKYNPMYNILRTIFCIFIPVLNVLLLASVVSISNKYKYNQDKYNIILLLKCICNTILVFYLCIAIFATVKNNWLTVYIVGASLLFGVYYEQNKYNIYIKICICVYAIISTAILLENTFYIFTNPKKLKSYEYIMLLNKIPIKTTESVLTTGWMNARSLFFLKDKPVIYSINCQNNLAQNQYAIWSIEFLKKLKGKEIKEILFLDPQDNIACVEHYFSLCTQIMADKKGFFVYKCNN